MSPFACISLNEMDLLRFFHFPSQIFPKVKKAIEEGWPKGLQQVKEYSDCIEYKLKGNIWWGQKEEAVPARRFVTKLLHTLLQEGWHLYASTDISLARNDKDTWIFELGPPKQNPMFSISLNESDKLRVIDCPEATIKVVKTIIESSWQKGLQHEKQLDSGSHEFKLKGNPWWGQGVESHFSRLFVVALLSGLKQAGWRLYAAVDISASQEDKDTWIFIQNDAKS